MRILVTGSQGLVGSALLRYCAALGDDVAGYNHQTLDISDPASVTLAVGQYQPQAIINCAAWTDVDGCETDRDRAMRANANGPENLARAARDVGALLITISTDYVFDGTKDGFYTQRDDPNPQSIYGKSKLEGERLAQSTWARTIIVRTGYVFGSGGRNFLSTVLGRARRGEPLKVITDTWGTPTYAPHLAARLRELALLEVPEVFHIVNSGSGATFEDFTRAALSRAEYETTIFPVTVAELARPAPRPRNSRLKCLVSEALKLPAMPSWLTALNEFVAIEKQSGQGENLNKLAP